MKVLRKLRPKVTVQNDFYVFDTETGYIKGDEIHWKLEARPEAFIFGVIYGYNYTRIIKNLDEFKKAFLEDRFKGKKVFAHQAGEYDLNVIYGNVYDIDPEAIFNGRFISATNGNCVFADSLNIYRTSVKRIGEMLGKHKGNLGSDKSGKKISKLVNGDISSEDINYCIRDCEIVWDALFMIFEEASDIKITQASLSMTYYRRFFQPYNIEHNDNTKFFWSSYYGGRTEAFKIGTTYARMIDVNSMYPDRMKHEVFPNPKFLKVEMHVSVNRFLNIYLRQFEGCAHLKIVHKDCWLGLLPYRDKKMSKLLFPTGNFDGWYNFNELRFALETGLIEIEQVICVVYAPPMDSPFSDYVDTLYLKRYQVENPFHIYRIKVYMNSLYGKFAQKIDTNYIYLDSIAKHIDLIKEHQKNGTFIKLDVFNDRRPDAFLVVRQEKNYAINYSIPSFASYITSSARVKLASKLLELKNNKPVYCDTDSIAYEIDFNVESNNKLGSWSKEEKIITDVRGLKNYSFIENGQLERKIKGVPKKAIEIAPNIFEYENLIKTKEAMRRNMEPGYEIRRIKQLTNKYDKRIVLENGETKPIVL